MYLVLTAMLALNVSKEILDAFVTVNNGLENTGTSFDKDIASLYAKRWTQVAGQLHADHLARCDEVIRRSRFIEPRILPLILPGDFV